MQAAAAKNTSGNVDEVLAARSVDLDVALTKMVFMSSKGKRSMFAAFKPYQRLTVTSSLLTQTQRHTASEPFPHKC